MNEHEPGALRRGHERDGHRVRGKRRPRLILQLRNVSAEVRLDHALLFCGNDEVRSFDLARNAESGKTEQRGAQVLDTGVGDAQLRPRHGGEPDEGADLDMVRSDAMGDRAESPTPIDGELVGADTFDR